MIAVVDDGGNLIALERLDGSFAAGAAISIGKARTAAIFKRPTRTFEDIIKNGRTAMIALPDFTPLQGGVPLMVGEDVVGGIGVSGAASARQDEEIALAGAASAKTLKPGMAGAATTRTVTFIDSAMVARGFDKGAVLVNTGSYMVHASHREADGIAEIHTFSPDEKHLYVGNWDPKRKVVMRYEVRPDGSVVDGRVFFDMTAAPGEDAIDGIKVDRRGNLYVSGPGGLWIISPAGTHLGTIKGPEHPHNLAWGDDDGRALYLAAQTGLYRPRLGVGGQP